jgi:hypothetical protein
MSCDKLVFDLSQEVEGSPNVFIRKDWINILDNQNTNYQNNQCIIDTSQLSNSNKYMGYREGYLAVPMLASYRGMGQGAGPRTLNDYGIGLKNWFGTMIHSFTLDYNGTTIVQQTPFCNLWNSFKLMTTLSWADVKTIGSSIGFYPDTSDSFRYYTIPSLYGQGICNCDDGSSEAPTSSTLILNTYNQADDVPGGLPSIGGNTGLTMRTKWICYNADVGFGIAGVPAVGDVQTYGSLLTKDRAGQQFWKSNITRKEPSAAAHQSPIIQISIMAIIQLKHIHSFFNMCPLLKGVFMKMTMNLNNSKCTILGTAAANSLMSCSESTSYVGGVLPIMCPSTITGNYNGVAVGGDATDLLMYYDLTVGAVCNNTNITNPTVAGSPAAMAGNLAKSVYLYVPAYTFNPTFESAYLSSNIKQIKYTDIYQYHFDIDGLATFNQLITNGIANIKSVLIVPFYRVNIGVAGVVPEYMSPFSPAGGGTTSPLVALTNFNIQISGQNAIYNTQRYGFEEWLNQLYGQNAVNGGLTDGLTSGLIDFNGFQNSYSYYYINVERMLPVEQSVPKSVQILGTSLSTLPIRFMVFVEYGVSVSIDVLTGARV